jgi:hypothetical protein
VTSGGAKSTIPVAPRAQKKSSETITLSSDRKSFIASVYHRTLENGQCPLRANSGHLSHAGMD